MPNLSERFQAAHDVGVSDLWEEIEHRARQPNPSFPHQARSAAWVAGVVVSVLLATGAFAAGILALNSALRETVTRPLGKPGAVTKIPLESRLGPPQDIAAGGGAGWALVGTGEHNEVYRIDEATGEVKELPETKGAQWVAAGEGAVWVTACPNGESSCGRGVLLRLVPATGQVVARIVLGDFPSQVVVGEGAVWVRVENHVAKIDPSTNRVVERFDVCCGLWGVAGGSLWMTDLDAGHAFRVDTRTGEVLAKIRAPKGDPCMVAVSEEAVWMASCQSPFRGDDSMVRIDPATNRIVSTSPISAATSISTGAGFLWMAKAANDDPGITVRKLDPRTDQFVGKPITVRYGPGRRHSTAGLSAGPPLFLAVGDRALWVNDFAEGAVIRIALG